jgi:hypothetical protein
MLSIGKASGRIPLQGRLGGQGRSRERQGVEAS